MDIVRDLDSYVKLIVNGDNQHKNEKDVSVTNSKPQSSSIAKENGNCLELKYVEKVLTSTELLLQLFRTNYEDRFSASVDYIFHQIQKLLDYAICRNLLTSMPLSCVNNIIFLIVDITINHSNEMNVKKLTSYYTCWLSELKLKQSYNCDVFICSEEEVALRLSIVSIIYETICGNKHVKSNEAVKELTACISGEVECRIYSQLIYSNSPALATQILVNIVPKYIECSGNSTILQFIWDEMSRYLRRNKDVEYSKMFLILCYLSELYFVASNKELMTEIFKDEHFWNLLQKGLIHPDSAVRKQALYIMKTSQNYTIKNSIHFNSLNDERRLDNFESSGRKLPLMYWESQVNYEEFKDMFIIMEYLEEKQIHLLKPIFCVIDRFLEKILCAKKFHISWLMLVLHRMISHDSMKIVKYGILNVLKIPASAYSEDMLKSAVKLLITSLNCTQIYMTDHLTIFEALKTYFDNCSKDENGNQFFKMLLKELCETRWSAEALFFIASSLQSIKLKKCWQNEEVNLIKNLIMRGTVNHYTYIRSGLQCQLLTAGINLIDTDSVSLEDIGNFLDCYERKISLQNKTMLWKNVVNWIRKSYTSEHLDNFLSLVDTRNIGKMIVILHEAHVDDEKFSQKIINLLKSISASFADIHNRPYFNMKLQDSYLSNICSIITESSGDLQFLNIFRPFLLDIVLFIKLQLNTVNHIRDFQLCKSYIDYLTVILAADRSNLNLHKLMNNWFENIVDMLTVVTDIRTSPMQNFIQIKTLNVIMDQISCEIHPGMKALHSYLRRELNSRIMRTSEDLSLTKDLQTLWGRMNSEFLQGKWQLLSRVLDTHSAIVSSNNAEFVSCCFEALDVCGYRVLLPLMIVLGKKLPSILDESRLEKLVEFIWKMIMERKKNEEFYCLMKEFVECLFQLKVLLYRSENIQKMLLDYAQRIFSENTTNAVNIFMKRVQRVGFFADLKYFFIDILPRALLFGQLQKKDERLIFDICSIVETTGLTPLTNDWTGANEVRARAVQIITSLNPEDESHCQFASDLVDALKVIEEKNKNKARYFSDSHFHRVKQRLMQSLLILESFMTKEKSEALQNWLSKKIIIENNQPSVRYLQEWLMLRILVRNPCLRDKLWLYFDEGIEKRTGSLCSLISIVYHSVKCLPREVIGPWIERSIQTFLPYCMAQHFSVRLYAQVTVRMLTDFWGQLSSPEEARKYELIKKSLYQSITRGNAVKNCAKMQDDFYFTVFDPVEHYSLETIFSDLPRLTSVSSDEWISDRLFASCGVDKTRSCIILKSTNQSLKVIESGRWLLDGSRQDNFIVDSEEKEDGEAENFQKKMIPVKYLVPDQGEVLQSVSYSCRKMTEKEGLVVVASLIDRIPNLGGLSRTCEIFGASELVIGSLKYLEDKQFQSLSVTAEKWIPVTEVKPFHLSEYLINMKRNGYTVLGAEQTINSQSLKSVKFPKKSILLLGNEKEGIPPTLLPLMDICVEIPQVGIIRSLNVHVTGALFIWEYAKQHHFASEGVVPLS